MPKKKKEELSPKAKAVTEALIAEGFWYCGTTKKFLIQQMENCGDWKIGGAFVEEGIGLDIVFGGDLFFKAYNEDAPLNQEEIERIKQLILQAESSFAPSLC